MTVPKPASNASAPVETQIEDLAAAALRDAPVAAAPVEQPKTIEFKCPQCDESISFPAELQGKQTPCPECRRIIKVPLLVKSDPKDWRKAEKQLPAGARRDTEPAPEGAWGSTAASAVSREALLEVAPPRRRPLTLRQKLTRGGILAGCVLVAAALTWIGFSFWAQQEQKQGYTKAMEMIRAEDNKLTPEARAALYTAAGVYRLRSESDAGTKEARDHFQQARKLLSGAADSVDRDLLLGELALAQIDLGGDSDQAVKGVRVKWDETAGEVRQTLQQIHDPEVRAYAFRQVSRKLIDRNQTDKIAPLARQLGAGGNAFAADPKARQQGASEDAPELFAVAGLECFRAGLMKEAGELAKAGLAMYKADGAQASPPVSSSLVALCFALNAAEIQPPKAGKGIDDEASLLIGAVNGTALNGHPDEARETAGRIELLETRLKALVALASAGKDKPDRQATEDAIALAEKRLQDQRSVSPWLLLQLVEMAAASGVADDRLQELVNAIPDANVSGRASLIILRAKLARTNEKADLAWAEMVNKNSNSSGQAHLEVARHNARRKALSVKDVAGWEENLRPFGYLGVALGRQDAE